MEVEHSRLLKFLKESRENKTEMAEKPEIPVIKIETDYQSPPNVKAEVPETQKIRESDEKSNKIENITGSEFKNTSSEEVTGSEVDKNNSTEVKITGADFTYSPVITVTKKESTLTKGDMKQQKITVTEDISEEVTENGCSRIPRQVETLTKTRHPDSITVETFERRSEERVTEKMEGEENNQDDTKSKIPLLRLKQAAETVRREREAQRAKGEQPRRSSIPKLNKDAKKVPIKRDISLNFTPQVDDEFDKLYEEIVDHKLKEVEEKLPSVSMEDPEKIETKFEEIIQSYDEDEHDKPTISRVSKIPALRRKPDEGSSRLGALIDRAKEKSTVTETKLKDGGFKVTASTIKTKRISRGSSKDLSSEQQIEVTETIDIRGDNDVFVEETVVKTEPTERTFRHITKRVLAENKATTDKHAEDDSQKPVVTENLDKKDGTMNKTKRFNRTVSKETRERNLNRELSKNLQDIRREFRNRIEDSKIDPEFNDFDDHDITTKSTAKENSDATTVRTEKIVRGVSKEMNEEGRNINSTETVTVEELEDGATRTVTTKTTESLIIGTPVVTEKVIRKITRERSTEDKHNSVTGVTSIEETTDEGGKKITLYVRENATGIPVKTERFTRGISREMGNIKQRSKSKDITTPINDNKQVLKQEILQTELNEKERVKGIPVYTKITQSFAKGKIENVEMSRTIEWKPADEIKTKTYTRCLSHKVTKKELKDAGKYQTPVAISEVTDVNDNPTDQHDNDKAMNAQKYPVLASKVQDKIKDLTNKITTKKAKKYKSDEQITNVEKTQYTDFSRSVSENVTKKEVKDAGKWKYETPVTIREVTDINKKIVAQNDFDQSITNEPTIKYPVLESKTQENIKDMANKITTKKMKEYKTEEQITNVEKTTYTLSSDIDLTIDRDYKVSREIGTQMSIDGKPVDRIFKYVKEFGTQMSVEGKSNLDLSFERDVKLAKEKNLPNKVTGSTTDKDASSKAFGTQMSTVEKTVVSSFDGQSIASREFGTQMSVVGKIVDRDFRVSKEIGTQMSLDGTKPVNDNHELNNENTANILYEESEAATSKLSNQDNDDIEVPILKGNVNRLKDIITKETVTVSTKEPEDELPKKKSVLSKIAIFERLEPKEPPVLEKRRIKCKYVPPNLNRMNSADRPKIVDELLKEPIQPEVSEDTKQVEIGDNYDEVTYRSEPAVVTEYWSTQSNVTNVRQVTSTIKATMFHSQQETKDFEVAKILPATIDFKPDESQVDLPKTTDPKVQNQRDSGVIEMPTIFPAKINYEADIGKIKPGKINLNVWSTQVEINKSTVDKIDILKEESLHDIAQTLPGKVDFKTYESHVPVSTDLPRFTDFKKEENQIQGVTTLPAMINFSNEEVTETMEGRVDSKIDGSQNEVNEHLPGRTQSYLVDDNIAFAPKIDLKSYEIQTEVATTLPGKIEETEIEKTLTAFGFVPVTKDNKKTETNLKEISTKPKPGKINLGLWQSQVETNKTFVGKTDIRKSKEAEMTRALSGRPDIFNRNRNQTRVTETIESTNVRDYNANIAKTNTAQIVILSEGPFETAQTLPGKIEFDFTENHAEVAKPLPGFVDYIAIEAQATISPLPETVSYSTATFSSQEEVATTLPARINFKTSEEQVEQPRILKGKIDLDMEIRSSESKAEISETIQDNIYYSSTENQTESITTFSSQNSVEKVGKLDLKAWEHQVEINKTLVDKIDVVKSEHLEEITNTLLSKKDVTYESHVGEAKTFEAPIDSNTKENKVDITETEGDAEANANKVEVAKILPAAISIDPFKHTPRFRPLPMLIRLNSQENMVLENETAQGGKDNVYKVDIPIDSLPVSPGFSIESNPLSPGFSDPELDDEDTAGGNKRNTESIIGSIKRKLFFITNKKSVQDFTNTPMNTPVVETVAPNDYEKRVDELQTKTYSISDIGPKTHEAKTVSSLTTTAENTYDIKAETIEESYSYTTDYNQSNFTTEYELNFDSNTVQNQLQQRQEDDRITSPSDYKQNLSDFENKKSDTNKNEFNFDAPRVENTLTRSEYGADDFKTSTEELKRAKSLAELDLGDVVHGKVKRIVGRIKSVDFGRRGSVKTEINAKELPRKMSVWEKIALFEI
ncbi:hypothetical protein PYW08_012810 [Mythimna loreyi]|uniref:Uncharacterized protein n=1 Tax=Mythimna loreyi TaxID=667449 RepID=A0ACC2Q1A3_9NEOP|nr:hypothetical protein PYW08_012810 [Mythimna loreyi]